MKISEIIIEGHDGKIPARAANASKGEIRFRDVGGYDRTYHLNRIMMATAMADGREIKAVDMDQSSWAEKYNLARPYSKEEMIMMQSALLTIDSEYDITIGDLHSIENADVLTASPIKPRGPIQLKSKK
jgi:hypothetical protein